MKHRCGEIEGYFGKIKNNPNRVPGNSIIGLMSKNSRQKLVLSR